MYRLLSRHVRPQIRCALDILQRGCEPLAKRSLVSSSAGFRRGELRQGPRTASETTQQASQRRDPKNPRNASSHRTIPVTGDGPAAKRDGANSQKKLSQQSTSPDVEALSEAVDRITRLFLTQQGIPSEETTLKALRALVRADVSPMIDHEEEPEVAGRQSASESTISHLLRLDNGVEGDAVLGSAKDRGARQDITTKISEAAYAIITHPAVEITTPILEEYIKLQGQLRRSETLPYVLSLYASKPRPRMKAGKIEYVKQNADRADHAIEASAAEAALDVALEAKNLVAAIAIIENSYATKAFVRARLIKTMVLPGMAAVLAPAVAWSIATNLAKLQTSMDNSLATTLAFMGFLTYFGVVGSLGVVVVTTANDQMKRVTWSPGQPLLQRWLREDERAALDKVACAFGFSEEHRWGEEDGTEWLALKEYMLQRDFILDAVELMGGME